MGSPPTIPTAANSEVSSSLEPSAPTRADAAHPLHRGIAHRLDFLTLLRAPAPVDRAASGLQM